MENSTKFEIGGRTFVKALNPLGIDHAAWFTNALNLVGANTYEPSSETPESFAFRIIAENNHQQWLLFAILAGRLLPEGVSEDEWTPEIAEHIGNYLIALRAPEDQVLVASRIAGVLIAVASLAEMKAQPIN